ncbi:Flp family type IVb pilin [Glaciibacter superstes]|uniref:Flp family type IVb pilin n=1 Tax=Glaciibacter superstes TaxID=501023 RepID=UPI0003B37BA0|nr:Flp family type IVb pilin [Glaciibacter superstes]
MLSSLVAMQSFFVSAKARLSREETGATAVEYGLLIGLIAVAIVAVLVVLGPQLAALFQGVSSKLPAVTTP